MQTGLFMASASASDQTQAFVFAHFTKCAHHSNPSHKKFLLPPPAAFSPFSSAKRQSEIPSKTKAKSSKKELRFPYLLQLASTIQFLKRHSGNQSA